MPHKKWLESRYKTIFSTDICLAKRECKTLLLCNMCSYREEQRRLTRHQNAVQTKTWNCNILRMYFPTCRMKSKGGLAFAGFLTFGSHLLCLYLALLACLHICLAANPFTSSSGWPTKNSQRAPSKKSHVSQSLAHGIEVKEFRRNSDIRKDFPS